MTVKETLADLVAIDSVSTRSNVEIIDYLSRRCEALGFQIKRLPYTDDKGVKKINLIAISDANFSAATPQVELALVGHTDTVPYDSNWREALQLNERDGRLFGRGACDTKAFIAAALTAVESMDRETIARPFALIFTADEEIGLIGAKRLAETRAVRARYAIVGEPTSLRPMRAGKGYCLAEIKVTGREAHSAYPQLGTSAVFGAARLISSIETIAQKLSTEQHPAFDPAYTTLNVGLVHGGTAKNVIAGDCHFTLEWRPIPGQNPGKLLELLKAAIDDEKRRDPEFICEMDAARTDQGFETPAGSQVVKMLEELTGNAAGTVAFGTEAAQMALLGAEAVVLGPGDIRVAHRTGEFVPVAELEACVNILQQAIERIC
ncbi:MAG TPA: acetylornithine deacetylase [Pyrinomonadaceae bacterium]|nr:acetylornithine deacetylase [Pyrinomonadaceae bacterium]